MGAYNLVLDVAATCPRCHVAASKDVQFKYGHLWQHRYAIGERVTWGGHNTGSPGRALVVVDGAADSACDACGYEGDWDFYVFVEHDVVVRVEPADGRCDFVGAADSCLDLGELPDGSSVRDGPRRTVTREEAMAPLEFEPGEVAVHTCACCGMDSETVHGFLYGPGGETTVYFAGYTRGHPERWASMVLSVGGWGDDTTPADRRALPLQVHVFEGALRFTFVSAEASPWNGQEFLGAMASVDDLTDDDRARYRSIASAAVQQDPRVAGYFDLAWRVGHGSPRGRIFT